MPTTEVNNLSKRGDKSNFEAPSMLENINWKWQVTPKEETSSRNSKWHNITHWNKNSLFGTTLQEQNSSQPKTRTKKRKSDSQDKNQLWSLISCQDSSTFFSYSCGFKTNILEHLSWLKEVLLSILFFLFSSNIQSITTKRSKRESFVGAVVARIQSFPRFFFLFCERKKCYNLFTLASVVNSLMVSFWWETAFYFLHDRFTWIKKKSLDFIIKPRKSVEEQTPNRNCDQNDVKEVPEWVWRRILFFVVIQFS